MSILVLEIIALLIQMVAILVVGGHNLSDWILRYFLMSIVALILWIVIGIRHVADVRRRRDDA